MRPRLGKLPLEARPALLVVPTEPVSLAAQAVLVSQRQLAQRCLVDEWHLRGAAPGGGKRHADGDHPDRE
jgi:hypothetical protein